MLNAGELWKGWTLTEPQYEVSRALLLSLIWIVSCHVTDIMEGRVGGSVMFILNIDGMWD